MNPFATHPQQQGVTYFEHWRFAMGIAYRLLTSVVAFVSRGAQSVDRDRQRYGARPRKAGLGGFASLPTRYICYGIESPQQSGKPDHSFIFYCITF
jgi:hypothetical protein